MVLVKSANLSGRDTSREIMESRGFRSYILNTSRGDICAFLGGKDSSEDRLPDLDMIKPKTPYVLAGREIKDTRTVIRVGNTSIGGDGMTVIAGPCSIESYEQIMITAERVKASGATVLRGGAFKPRSSPYAFQGMGVEGLKLLRKAGDRFDMPVVTEVLDPDDISAVSEYSDILQIGARNCQNYSLLKKVAKAGRPILLKRGMMSTIEELLMSAEYILSEGNMDVILCERGIRTFGNETRSSLDITAIPLLKASTHLPVIADPSHAAGTWKLVEPLSLASIAAGADGLMIEVHNDPEKALCDGPQSLRPDRFDGLMKKLAVISEAVGKGL
jgi:3-deoxy-7-phosphoheptulonate synthase